MNLSGILNEEENLIRGTLESYCQREVTPNIEKWILKKQFPGKIMKDLSEFLLPATIAHEGFKQPISEVSQGLLSETMGKYEFPVPAFLTMHFSKLFPFINDVETRNNYIGRYVKGNMVICGAFTEPGHGSDAASISTRLDQNDETLILTGEKAFLSSPSIADVCIASVRSGEPAGNRKSKGISLLAVDMDADGLEAYETENMASMYRGDFGGIRFDEVRVPKENLVGSLNTGFEILMKVLGIQRVHVALYSIGLAESCLQEALEYSKNRVAFGSPISKFQAVSFRLAEDWTKLEAAKLLAYKALAMKDMGLDSSSESSGVKWFGCEAAFDAASHALQTMGATGYVKSSPLERKFRSSRGFLIGDGTPDIQKLIIARNLLGKEYSP